MRLKVGMHLENGGVGSSDTPGMGLRELALESLLWEHGSNTQTGQLRYHPDPHLGPSVGPLWHLYNLWPAAVHEGSGPVEQ